MNTEFYCLNKNLSAIGNTPVDKTDYKFIQDEYFIGFIKRYNGAYFFNNSLHFFRLGYKTIKFHDFALVNKLIQDLYGNIVCDISFFSEDIFGNLFGFESSGGVILFNIESAKKELVASDFKSYVEAICTEPEYFTGKQFTSMVTIISQLKHGYRLCPKYPFILGGEFDYSNLVIKGFEENLRFSSDLARQIKGYSDGTKFKINIP